MTQTTDHTTQPRAGRTYGTGCVLVVEDDPALGVLYSAGLAEDGYDVVHADTALEARVARDEHEIEFVLLDLDLAQGTGGREVLEDLSSIPLADRPAIVLVVDEGDPAARADGYAFGAAAVLAKPVNLSELLAVMAAVGAKGRPTRTGEAINLVPELVPKTDPRRTTLASDATFDVAVVGTTSGGSLSDLLGAHGLSCAASDDVSWLVESESSAEVVVVDVPRASLPRALEELRAPWAATHTAILIALVDGDDIDHALDAGADDVMRRPPHVRLLSARIAAMVGRSDRASLTDTTPTSGSSQSNDGDFERAGPLSLTMHAFTIASAYCPMCESVVEPEDAECSRCGHLRPEQDWPPVHMSDHDWLGMTLNNRFQLLQYLGGGATGAVYRARDRHLSRDVAAKIVVLAADGDDAQPLQLRQLKREVQAIAVLRSPHVVRFHDVVGIDDHTVALVMDLVEGHNLRDLVGKMGSLDLVDALAIARQVLLALVEAHRAGFIHRDIKPDNIMIEALAARVYHARVLDFGVVELRDRVEIEPDEKGKFFGTPKYAAPEQIASHQSVDSRTDLYALGCVIHFMLTGKPPFDDGNAARVLQQHMVGAIPRVGAKVLPAKPVRDAVNALLSRLLAKDPGQRPPTAVDALDAVEEVMHLCANQRRQR